MNASTRAAVLAAALAASIGTVTTPTPANASFFWNQFRADTPQCRDHPDYRFIGRIAGSTGARPVRNVSVVGCFPTMAACERWRRLGSGRINGRIIRSDCSTR